VRASSLGYYSCRVCTRTVAADANKRGCVASWVDCALICAYLSVCDCCEADAWCLLTNADYLAKHCFDRLNGVTCPVAIARGTGGWPTDFLTDLMPAVADRLPRGSLIT
jgi:hypothetical protein